MATTTQIFCDASVNRKRGMGFAWIAVQNSQMIAEGGGRIPTAENPDFGSTTAEAIGLYAAHLQTVHLENRQFFCDSQSLAHLIQTRKQSANQRLAKLLQVIPNTVYLQFENQSPYIKIVDNRSKRPNLYNRVSVPSL